MPAEERRIQQAAYCLEKKGKLRPMLFKLIRAIVIYFLICFPFSIALGCVYSIRDVGFTDIGSVPYHLYCYIRADTSENFASALKQISYAALIDSNVEVEIINVDQQKAFPDHMVRSPAMKYLDFWELQSFPAAILVSPKGQSLVLPIFAPDKPFLEYSASLLKEMIWSALESVVISQKRKEIISSVVETYCAVLLIQGQDAAENEKAQRKVTNAIEEIGRLLNQMTRPINEPPRLIVIPQELFSQERVLLWSLNINRAEADVPRVAVIYGRGRWIGSLFEGEEIIENRVFNILSVIGESCECGIDKEWMMGMMLPLRWEEKTQWAVAKSLGFDVESPMVKTEISQILALKPSPEADEPSADRFEGYSEIVVEPESSPTVAAVSPAQLRQLASRRPDASDTGDHGRHPYRMALYIIGGMALLISAGGVFIMLRGRLVKHRGTRSE